MHDMGVSLRDIPLVTRDRWDSGHDAGCSWFPYSAEMLEARQGVGSCSVKGQRERCIPRGLRGHRRWTRVLRSFMVLYFPLNLIIWLFFCTFWGACIFLTWIQDAKESLYAVFHTSVSRRLEQSDIDVPLMFYLEAGSRKYYPETRYLQGDSGSNFGEFHLLN